MARSGKRLQNTTYPFLRLYIPKLDQYRDFEAGVLVVEGDDEAYEEILEQATKDPTISIYGINEEGDLSALKDSAPANVICDICAPAQAFHTADERDLHVAALHTNAPVMDAEGNIREGAERVQVRQGQITTSTVVGGPTAAAPAVKIPAANQSAVDDAKEAEEAAAAAAEAAKAAAKEAETAAAARPPVQVDAQIGEQASDLAARAIAEASTSQGQAVAEKAAIDAGTIDESGNPKAKAKKRPTKAQRSAKKK